MHKIASCRTGYITVMDYASLEIEIAVLVEVKEQLIEFLISEKRVGVPQGYSRCIHRR
jgi:hypothetical protein